MIIFFNILEWLYWTVGDSRRFTEYNRSCQLSNSECDLEWIGIQKHGQWVAHARWMWLIFCAALYLIYSACTKCSVLLTKMSLKSPGFINWWPRCLNLNVAKASQSERVCEAVWDACLHLSHLGLLTSPSLNRCPLNWQCLVTKPLSILNWFLLGLNNFPCF
jgi:hypothetical protein